MQGGSENIKLIYFKILHKSTYFYVLLCNILKMASYLQQFNALKVFTLSDAINIIGTSRNAIELLRRYIKKGYILKIRRDLYTAAEMASGVSTANYFEIASSISPVSYVAYHSALEFHGIAHQQFFDVYVSSDIRFRNFEFENVYYQLCRSLFLDGVIVPPLNSKIKVSNLERTIIDCIDRIDRAGGLEELVHALTMIKIVREDMLLSYLKTYNKDLLYKKAGFILSYFQRAYKLTDIFFSICKKRRNESINFLTNSKEGNTFHKEWILYAPNNILSYLEQGPDEFI